MTALAEPDGPVRLHLRLLAGSRRLLIVSVALSVLQAVLLVPIAGLLRHAFDEQLPNRDAAGVTTTALLILALYAGTAALGLATRYVSLKVNKDAIARLRVAVTERLYGLGQGELDRSSDTVLQSVVVQDTERVDVASNAAVALLIPAAIVVLGLTAVAFAVAPLLAAALLVVVPAMVASHRAVLPIVRRRTRRWQRAFDVFASATALGLRAASLTRVHAAEPMEIERRSGQIADLSRAGLDMAWAGGAYHILQNAISACVGVIVLILGAGAVARGDMTIGDLIGFYAITALLLQQVGPIIGSVPVIVIGYEALARLEALLQTGDEPPYEGTDTPVFDGSIAFEGVSFGYRPGHLVLDDVDLHLTPGEHLAIVGPNGAGKSTLTNLLLGLYRPTGGRLLAAGVPYDDLDMAAFRRSLGVVLQDPLILPGTVAENIAYGRPHASAEAVVEAARRATAAEFIATLPEGYATRVGDDGVGLSAGQRQRVAVARALLREPVLLVLDEPTTHLDDTALAALLANLDALPTAPAIVAISHDPAVEAWADRVLRLRDGRLAPDALAGAPRG